MPKDVTLDKLLQMKDRAIQFLDNIGEPSRADEFEEMSPEEYAERKGVRVVPNPGKLKHTGVHMAAKQPTKAELESRIAELEEQLEEKDSEITDLNERLDEVAQIVGVEEDEDDEDEDEEEDEEEDDEDEGE